MFGDFRAGSSRDRLLFVVDTCATLARVVDSIVDDSFTRLSAADSTREFSSLRSRRKRRGFGMCGARDRCRDRWRGTFRHRPGSLGLEIRLSDLPKCLDLSLLGFFSATQVFFICL